MAQQLGAYEDVMKFLYVFDGGKVDKLESQPVKEFKVARDRLVWINNVGQFKIYENGYSKVIRENAPNSYGISDNFMVYELGGQLYVYERQRSRRVANFAGTYAFSDSVLAFIDFNAGMNVYYRGQTRNLEVFDVADMQVGKNTVAYMDNLGQFYVFWAGENEQLDHLQPQEFRSGRNTVAYVDNYGRFKIFHKGNLIDADPFKPREFQVGDDMVVWINRNNQFMVFEDGLITMIEDVNPDKFTLKDAVVAYEMPNQHFKAYYKMQTYLLESYIPEKYKIDNEILAWVDYMNNLHGLAYGERIRPADRIVTDFEVNLDVITSDVNRPRPQFYYQGEIY